MRNGMMTEQIGKEESAEGFCSTYSTITVIISVDISLGISLAFVGFPFKTTSQGTS